MLDLNLVIFYASGFAASILLSICIFILATAEPYVIIKRTKKEECFVDPRSGEVSEFPSSRHESSLDLSVIVPAYNEEARCKAKNETFFHIDTFYTDKPLFTVTTGIFHSLYILYWAELEKKWYGGKSGSFDLRNLLVKYMYKSKTHPVYIVMTYFEVISIPSMLEECIDYLENSSKKYEIIVVSDGSTDGTVSVANKFCERMGTDKFRVLELETNRGKGGAVRLGMLSARGALLLFADADGATKFSDYAKVENALRNILEVSGSTKKMALKSGIAIGSRAHLEKESIAQRSIFRTILMYGFHAMVWLFAVKGIKDTQCGFKLFTRGAAVDCFESLHVERWAFDVEILKIAQSLKIPIAEVPVNWTEIEGSKVTPVLSWIEMAIDLALIWLRYTIGAWKIKAEHDRIRFEKTKNLTQ